MTSNHKAAGLTHYRQENGIFVHCLQDNRRETFDRLIEQASQDELTAFAEGSNACFLLDLRGQWVTPYAIVRLIQTSNTLPAGLEEWIAVVGGDSFAVRMLESTIRKFPTSVRLSVRIFQTAEPALDWLEQKRHEFDADKQK